MTIEELNSLLEAISNSPTDDALRLDNFGKIRTAYENVLKEIADAKANFDKLNTDYENLKGVKTKEFFAPVDNSSDSKTDDNKESGESTESNESDVTIEDLFDDNVEIVDNI